MAETDEMLVSVIIFFFILLLFYIKFGKKIAAGSFLKSVKEKFKGKLGGKIKRPKWPLKTVVVWTIVALFGFLMIYNGILEVPDREIGATELQSFSSGDCKENEVKNLVCTGPFTITIADPAELTTIGKLTVVPGSDPIKELNISAGLYLAEYSQGDLKQFVSTACVYAPEGIYHQAMIYYNGKKKVNACVAVPAGLAPEPLYFGTNWLRLMPLASWIGVEDPQFFVGLEPISTSSIIDVPQQYMRYPVILSSNQDYGNTTYINSLKIVHSRYKII